MLDCPNLWETVRARLKDAEVLLQSRRYDGAVYVCGYAIEIALKERICRTLDWPEFFSTKREFDGLQSFKTHDLDILLHLSGVERTIDWRNGRVSRHGTQKHGIARLAPPPPKTHRK